MTLIRSKIALFIVQFNLVFTILSTNHYEPATTEQLEQYNQVVANYYHERGNDGLDWQKQIANTFAKPVRPAILPYLQSQGYAKR